MRKLSRDARELVLRFLADKRAMAKGHIGAPLGSGKTEEVFALGKSSLDSTFNNSMSPFPHGLVSYRDQSGNAMVQLVALVDPFNFGNNPRPLGNSFIIGSPTAPGTTQANVGIPGTAAMNLSANALAVSNFASVYDNLNGVSVLAIFVAGINAQTALHTTNVAVIDLRNLHDVLVVKGTTSGGTFTLQIDGSVDNSNFITIVSVAAASTQQFFDDHGVLVANGASYPLVTGTLSPLGFRYIRVTLGDAGVGNTTTLTVSAK